MEVLARHTSVKEANADMLLSGCAAGFVGWWQQRLGSYKTEQAAKEAYWVNVMHLTRGSAAAYVPKEFWTVASKWKTIKPHDIIQRYIDHMEGMNVERGIIVAGPSFPTPGRVNLYADGQGARKTRMKLEWVLAWTRKELLETYVAQSKAQSAAGNGEYAQWKQVYGGCKR